MSFECLIFEKKFLILKHELRIFKKENKFACILKLSAIVNQLVFECNYIRNILLINSFNNTENSQKNAWMDNGG